MLKRMTGSKVGNKKMETLKGGEGEPIFAIYDNWCDCYCADFCGIKAGTDKLQRDGQYEYRE